MVFPCKDGEPKCKVIETYINDYINGIGGYDKLELYTEEELEEIDQEQVDDLMETLEWFKRLFE